MRPGSEGASGHQARVLRTALSFPAPIEGHILEPPPCLHSGHPRRKAGLEGPTGPSWSPMAPNSQAPSAQTWSQLISVRVSLWNESWIACVVKKEPFLSAWLGWTSESMSHSYRSIHWFILCVWPSSETARYASMPIVTRLLKTDVCSVLNIR